MLFVFLRVVARLMELLTRRILSGGFFTTSVLVFLAAGLGAKEPRVEILSPRDGARIVQEQSTILVSGKVSAQESRTPNVDIVFVIDTSGSTAHYAGVDFGDSKLPTASGLGGRGSPQIGIFGGGLGLGVPPLRDLRNSILAAEVGAARRLLTQLNPETTRVGVVTFAEQAQLVQPLTHDYQQAKQALEEIFIKGPYGGTNMAEGIRAAIRELAGLGRSERRTDAVKVQLLLTDGFPTLPIGGGRKLTLEDTDLAISAARIAGKAGIKIHVFALGEEALSYPRAAVGIAGASGGILTPVVRPADILGVLEDISVVGIDYITVLNETTGQRATQLRLATDGFFSSALPVAEGLNRIQVLARSGDGSIARGSVSVYYEHGGKRSLELEVFLEKERNLKLEVERLGKTREEIERQIDRGREESLKRSQNLPPANEINEGRPR